MSDEGHSQLEDEDDAAIEDLAVTDEAAEALGGGDGAATQTVTPSTSRFDPYKNYKF